MTEMTPEEREHWNSRMRGYNPLTESAEREANGERAFTTEMTLRNPHSLPVAGDRFRLVFADDLPVPRTLDPVVFGPDRSGPPPRADRAAR
jgi:hypothetical protein